MPATPSSRRGASRVVAAGKGSDAAADAERTPSPIASVAAFAKANYFLLGMFACVFVAAAHPSIGANGGPLKPEVTINKLAVRLMFLISGLSLPLDDLRSAVTNVAANALIQFFVFGFAGLATAFGIAPALTALGTVSPRKQATILAKLAAKRAEVKNPSAYAVRSVENARREEARHVPTGPVYYVPFYADQAPNLSLIHI